MGTPPRMRGKPRKCKRGFKEIRNTPAYAGKTETTFARNFLPSEHPRVCGENCGHLLALALTQRNTPAYAGKTKPLLTSWCAFTEHPRVCGENTSPPARLPGETRF